MENKKFYKGWFYKAWRPLIGYIIAMSLGYNFIFAPFLHSIFMVFGKDFPLPSIDVGMLVQLVLAMLGLAGMRTYEKVKSVNNNNG